MKVLSIVGTRPQYVKLAPIIEAFRNSGLVHEWLDTGQHYSDSMSGNLLQDLGITPPCINLKVGSGSHSMQTAIMMIEIEKYLMSNPYDVIMVYGDTNSTLAGALTAAKLGIPIVHIEAGLRSSNKDMPEEINRIIVDHISTLHFAPTQIAVENLIREGLIHPIFSGDVMYDVLLNFKKQNVTQVENTERFILCTIHRAENTDNHFRLRKILDRLNSLPIKVQIPAHPRLIKQINTFGIEISQGSIELLEPLAHTEVLRKVLNSQLVITDSGGLQKESFMLKKLCITVRSETEWPETLANNWNALDYNLDQITELVNRPVPTNQDQFFGNGKAASIILDSVSKFLAIRDQK